MDKENNQTSSFRAGYVAIVGKPNVGKSTLMNNILHHKLAIVSPKPQTTRHRILGILNRENCQAIFLDTPGIMHPKYLLQETMVKTARKTMREADLILMMVEATGLSSEDEEITELLTDFKVPKLLAINKIDLIPKDRILSLIDHFQATKLFQEIVPISALKADGLDILTSLIIKFLPAGEPFYPQDMISDEPERFFVSEIIREKIFLLYGEEIPYATTVQVEDFYERQGKKDFIRAVIVVERDSQKGILIGKGGQALKKVGKQAREDIERFLGRSVFLQLEVRVKKKWRKDASLMRRLGY